MSLSYNPTLKDALEWNRLTDKYVFCIDILGIRGNTDYADSLVTALEESFEELIKEEEKRVKELLTTFRSSLAALWGMERQELGLALGLATTRAHDSLKDVTIGLQLYLDTLKNNA